MDVESGDEVHRGYALAEKVRAVLESIVFALQDNLVLMRQAQPGITQISISGGVAQWAGFCQMLANLTGLMVQRSEDIEASARGASLYLRQCLHLAMPAQSASAATSLSVFVAQTDDGLQARYAQHRNTRVL